MPGSRATPQQRPVDQRTSLRMADERHDVERHGPIHPAELLVRTIEGVDVVRPGRRRETKVTSPAVP
jgi:hypothetical protein